MPFLTRRNLLAGAAAGCVVRAARIAYRSPIGEFLRFYRDFMQAAPDELAIEVNITVLGAPNILAIVCWSGDAAESDRVLRPLRDFGPPRPPPGETGPMSDYWRGASLRVPSEAAVKDSYVGNYTRLARLKRQYDPRNFFRGNHNFKPAAA
jgi:hypothetical protein